MYICNSVGYISRSGLLGYIKYVSVHSWWILTKSFPKQLYKFILSLAKWDLNCFSSLPILNIISAFNFNQSDESVVASHCGLYISLVGNWVSFHMFIDHLDVGKGAVVCGAYSRFLAIFLFCQMPFSWWPVIYTMMWLIMVNWNNQIFFPFSFTFSFFLSPWNLTWKRWGEG